MILSNIRKDLKQYSDPYKAQKIASFFKTSPGTYGYGDIFIGVTVPERRLIMKKYQNQITIKAIKELLISPIHEERFLALLFMIQLYYQKTKIPPSRIIRLYLTYAHCINSWDLVDLSAHTLLGDFLWMQNQHQQEKSFPLLKKLAQSQNLWERRIAIVSTWFFIKQRHLQTTFNIAQILIHDHEDLIHKAVGWMLRETGKKDMSQLISFLNHHCPSMPRTMLRYAIEKFPKKTYQQYLKYQM